MSGPTRRTALCLLLAGALAAGCETTDPAAGWGKAGASPAQRGSDVGACTRHGQEVGWIGWRGENVYLPTKTIDPACMEKRGYSKGGQ